MQIFSASLIVGYLKILCEPKLLQFWIIMCLMSKEITIALSPPLLALVPPNKIKLSDEQLALCDKKLNQELIKNYNLKKKLSVAEAISKLLLYGEEPQEVKLDQELAKIEKEFLNEARAYLERKDDRREKIKLQEPVFANGLTRYNRNSKINGILIAHFWHYDTLFFFTTDGNNLNGYFALTEKSVDRFISDSKEKTGKTLSRAEAEKQIEEFWINLIADFADCKVDPEMATIIDKYVDNQ